jgi:hypothetical protein
MPPLPPLIPQVRTLCLNGMLNLSGVVGQTSVFILNKCVSLLVDLTTRLNLVENLLCVADILLNLSQNESYSERMVQEGAHTALIHLLKRPLTQGHEMG